MKESERVSPKIAMTVGRVEQTSHVLEARAGQIVWEQTKESRCRHMLGSWKTHSLRSERRLQRWLQRLVQDQPRPQLTHHTQC